MRAKLAKTLSIIHPKSSTAVAKRKKRKTGWLGKLLFCICTPLIIWFLAVVIWFYWSAITGLFGRGDNTPSAKTDKEVERSTKPSDKSTQERIGEEDRRKLEEILRTKR